MQKLVFEITAMSDGITDPYQFWRDFFDQLDIEIEQDLIGPWFDEEQDCWSLDLRGATVYPIYLAEKQALWSRLVEEQHSGAWLPRLDDCGDKYYCLADSIFMKGFPEHWARHDVISYHSYEDELEADPALDVDALGRCRN